MSFIVRWVHKKGRKQGWFEYHIRGTYPDETEYEERRKSPRSTKTASERFAEDREKILHDEWKEKRGEKYKAPKLKDLFKDYIEVRCPARRNMPSTIKLKKKIYALYLEQQLGPDTYVDKIDDIAIEKLTASLKAHEPKTVNNALDELQLILGYAVQKKQLVRMPHIQKLKVEQKLPKYLVLADYQKLIAAAEQLAREGMWQPLVLCKLGGDCGLRLQELIALPWKAVDLIGRKIFVHHAWSEGSIVMTKGKRFRVVPIERDVVEMLVTHRHDGELVLRHDGKTQHGKHNDGGKEREVTPRVAYRWFGMAVARAGIEPNGLVHVLRHTFGSHLAENKTDPHRLRDLLGHANLSTTEIYARIGAESTRSAIEGLAEFRKTKH